MKAYVLIRIRPGELSDVVNQLRKVAGVVEASITFGPFDAVAIVDAKDINQLGRIVSSGIQPIPGINETLTCLATEA